METPAKSEAVLVHVLFMDIIGCSKLPSDEQNRIIGRLKDLVSETAEYQHSHEKNKVISLPTGDGMALAFFDKLDAAVRCAIEVSRAIQAESLCKIRMGVHTGPVFVMDDINGTRNISGAGINHAERVMSCGGAGHILISDNAAESLRHLSTWRGKITEIGECQVKDGWIRVWNLVDGPIGNSARPAKSKYDLHQRRLLGAVGVLAVTLILAAVLASAFWILRSGKAVDRPFMRLSVDLSPDAVAGQFTTTTISPDGSRLVFPAKSPDGKQMLATRLLDEAKPALLSGTENGTDPFFSPDGQWIGFFADGKMKKISVQRGAPVVLCDAPNARGATWGEDGNIVVALNNLGPLSRLSAEGGPPQLVSKPQGALTHRWPQALPGNEAILFTLSSSIIDFDDASIATVSLKTGAIKTLVRGGYFGRYMSTGDATGHLTYVHEGVLFAVPFDPVRLELRGTAVPLLDDLGGDPNSGAGQFSFSRTGNLVYRTGRVLAQSWPVSWLDNSGKTQPLIAKLGFYITPRFSPDGQRLALVQIFDNDRGIFIYDWKRDTTTRVTFNTGQQTSYPTWSPDGKHIVFRFASASGFSLGWIRADGAGQTQRLLDSKNNLLPYSFFPDGRLAYYELDSDSGWDIWTLALDLSDPDHPKPGKPELFLRTPSNEHSPAVSPDGRWIAYDSDESGKDEVYVRPFPGPGGKWQISTAGGQLPVWSHNGRELFFQDFGNHIMAIEYEGKNESFVAGKTYRWSDQQLRDLGGNLNYDLASDGKRFAIFTGPKAMAQDQGNVHINFLLNFFDELRRRAPISK